MSDNYLTDEFLRQHPYTFEDAVQDAQDMGIPSQMTGMGIRFDMHDEPCVEEDSVRISDPEEARAYLDDIQHKREDLERVITEEVARVDAAFKKLERTEDMYRQNFGPIPPLTEKLKKQELR